MNVNGLDVSHWQGSVDWTKVKAAGYSFAFVSATEGISYLDPNYLLNFAQAKAAGLLVGAYHFAHPKNDPMQEANWFLNAVKRSGYGDLPLILDIEVQEITSGNDTWSQKWLDAVQKTTNHAVGLYSSEWFAETYLSSLLSKYPTWVAKYSNTAPSVKYDFWQQSSTGQVSGVTGNVDLDIFNGTLDDLKKLCGDNMQSYPEYNVVVNQNVYRAMAVNGVTYVLYTALNEYKTPYSLVKDSNGQYHGVMLISGKQVQCVQYDGTTFVPYTALADGIQSSKVEWWFHK